ncbi:MAG TPA: tetratricopeptide repeat protein [Kofleriaceae bacterium]|nr:tetratricopeptide repeat protein [Kofleriaceae bacterium]
MTDARQISILLQQAERQRRLGNHRGATQLAQRALALDPDHAVAHATLARVLLDARRLAAAGLEVRTALGLDGNDPYIHRVAAAVLTAERKLDDAWQHCLIAMQSGPEPAAYVLGATIRKLAGDRGQARELLLEALALEAADTDALTQLAQLALEAGDLEDAVRQIVAALESDPSDVAAHVVAGRIDLARGDLPGAEQHARFVLGADATDRGGLALWSAIQVRRSWLLGMWWRWNAWLTLGSERRRLGILLGEFVLVQIAIILADERDLDGVARALRLAWLGLCAYTWFAPALFRRMVARTLATVRLDPDY